jgi:glycosyltransferase involved in cell wall biosynthesis
MKISFLIAKDLLEGEGGIEKVTREVGRRLVARGHSVIAYSTTGDGACPTHWEGMQVRWLPRAKPYWTEKVAGSLYGAALARFRDPQADIYHLHSVAAGATARLLRGWGAGCVLQMHGIEWQRSRWGNAAKATLQVLEKVSFAGASAVTAVSREQCRYYEQHFHMPVVFIPTGTALSPQIASAHLAAIGIEPGKYFFTAVRLVREKGLHYLIPAFRKAGGDWKLVIAGGDGGDREYLRQLRELAMGCNCIRFMGHVKEPLLGELYSSAGAYVQASEIEGMSISLLDAMSYSRCCIVSDIPENLDALGDSGLSFHAANIDDLARQMRWVVQSRRAAGEIGERAKARVLREFSWDSVTDNLEDLYRKTADLAASRTVAPNSAVTVRQA